MEGIFNKLFKIKLNSHNNPYEDYLTELLCYCLQNDKEILNDFLLKFKIYTPNPEEEYLSFHTQEKLKALPNHHCESRPDMVLNFENATIYFENKISSGEGNKQLKRYAEHLNELDVTNKILVYITRDYDKKNIYKITENCTSSIKFIQLRWFEVFHLLKKHKEKPLILELLKFLKDLKLSMNNQFTPTDLITLNSFSNTLNLIDETMFGDVSSLFKKTNGSISQPLTCFTNFKRYDRYIYTSDQNYKLWCGLGYWMNSKNEKEYPELGLVLEVSPNSSKRKEIIQIFKEIREKRENWKSYSLENNTAWSGIYIQESLQTFISSENQIIDIQNYFKEILIELKNIYELYPILKK